MFRKLLPAVAAPLLLVAACGSSSDALSVETASPVAALQQAPDAAAEAGSAHVEVAITTSIPDGDTPVTIEGSGDYDTEAGTMAMQVDLRQAISQLGALAGKDTPAGFDEPMRVVADGTTAYLYLPFLAELTGTVGWLSMPLSQLGESGLGDLGGIGATGDAAAMLDYLRGAGEVHEAGHEEIDGVDTTKYTATVDLDKALAKAPAASREQLQTSIDDLGADLQDLPITVWVDDGGRPRRMELTLDLPGKGTSSITMTWSEYGEPVSVDIPDPDEVTPASELLGGLASSFLGNR